MAIEESEFIKRTAALRAVIEQYNDPRTGRGGITAVSSQIGVSESYISRCLYPPNKAGRKRIGDDFVLKMNKVYPGWLAGQLELAGMVQETPKQPYRLGKLSSVRDRRLAEIMRHAENTSTEALLVLLDKAKDLAKEYPKETPKTAS